MRFAGFAAAHVAAAAASREVALLFPALMRSLVEDFFKFIVLFNSFLDKYLRFNE